MMITIGVKIASNLNKASLIRASKVFDGESVVLLDNIEKDPHVETTNDLNETIKKLKEKGYVIWAVDNLPEYNPKSLYEAKFTDKVAFLYGNEKDGLSLDEINICDDMVFIPMTGASRSLNVAQAASIIMSEYSRQKVVENS